MTPSKDLFVYDNLDASGIQATFGLDQSWVGKTWDDHAAGIARRYIDMGYRDVGAGWLSHLPFGRLTADVNKMPLHAAEQRRIDPAARSWAYDGFADAIKKHIVPLVPGRRMFYGGNIYPNLINETRSPAESPLVQRRILASMIPVFEAGFNEVAIDASAATVEGSLTHTYLLAMQDAGRRVAIEGAPVLGFNHLKPFDVVMNSSQIKNLSTCIPWDQIQGKVTILIDEAPHGEHLFAADNWLGAAISGYRAQGFSVGVMPYLLTFTTSRNMRNFV